MTPRLSAPEGQRVPTNTTDRPWPAGTGGLRLPVGRAPRRQPVPSVLDCPLCRPSRRWSTYCPYCSLQCGMDLAREDDGLNVTPRGGGLCQKGWTSVELLAHPGRLTEPLMRAERGAPLVPVSWDARSIASWVSSRHRADPRPRRRRRLRRRRAHEREGLRARQVRARRAGHGVDRLQRPFLHVLRRERGPVRVRDRSRPAVPARGHRARRRVVARRVQRGRDDAAGAGSPRRSAAQRWPADRRRPTRDADGPPR